MATKIIPTTNRIMIKPGLCETRTEGGIYIPPTAQEDSLEGLVVEVGRSSDATRPSLFEKGDKVRYGKFAGTRLKIGSEEFIFMNEEDVLCIIREE